MAEITAVITSIDELAAYKLSDDLLLELVSVTVGEDPERAAGNPSRVEAVEPLELIKHQPPGGYFLDNHQVKLTCAKSAGVRLGDPIKFRIIS
jgi:hypothetical protein